MDMVITSLIAAVLASAVPTERDPVARWRPYTDEAATRCGVPVAWIERVIRAESGGLTTLGGRPITSRAGAMGLMQLMPATWTAMRQRLALGFDPHDPRDNIVAGSCYLRSMYDRFGYPGLFAAYNAGPGRYTDHLASGRSLPDETRAYLATLVGSGTGSTPVSTPSSVSIFFSLRARRPATTPSSTAPTSSIFVTLGSEVSPP